MGWEGQIAEGIAAYEALLGRVERGRGRSAAGAHPNGARLAAAGRRRRGRRAGVARDDRARGVAGRVGADRRVVVLLAGLRRVPAGRLGRGGGRRRARGVVARRVRHGVAAAAGPLRGGARARRARRMGGGRGAPARGRRAHRRLRADGGRPPRWPAPRWRWPAASRRPCCAPWNPSWPSSSGRASTNPGSGRGRDLLRRGPGQRGQAGRGRGPPRPARAVGRRPRPGGDVGPAGSGAWQAGGGPRAAAGARSRRTKARWTRWRT